MFATNDQRCMFYEGAIIMEKITEYLLSITIAAVICVAVKYILGRNSAATNMVAVVSGIFMLLTIVSPVVKISLGDISQYLDGIYIPADDVVSPATKNAQEEMKKIVKSQSEAFILEEAERMSLSVGVEVNISNGTPPAPDYAIITGNISPYNKKCLSEFIYKNLGISQENLQWK